MGFPNFKSKHTKDSMFTPREYMTYLRKIGKYPSFRPPIGVIFCFQRKLLEYIVKHHKTTKVDAFSGEMYLLDETEGKIAIIGKFGIGSPAVVTLLEELIAFGVKKFMSIGTAGTLQKEIRIGSLIVCEKAIRDEGTSHHYVKTGKYAYPSKELTQKIKLSLQNQHFPFVSGSSWTIDAPFRETVAEAKQYQKEGVLTVEMEASALFTVAKYRAVELGAIFTISDSLAELKWAPKFHSNKVDNGLEKIYRVAVDVLLQE